LLGPAVRGPTAQPPRKRLATATRTPINLIDISRRFVLKG
jgi:hypothetical protein